MAVLVEAADKAAVVEVEVATAGDKIMVVENIIYIADPEILAIPIKECNEPLIDIKNTGDLSYGPPPENEFTTNDYTKMRETVYKKLLAAQADLPKGLRFRIYEGYRSKKVQKLLFDEMHEQMVKRHPDFTPEEIFHETTRLVSPIINFDGTENDVPAHNSGGAIDIEIMDEAGNMLGMGMESKDWIQVEPDLCNTRCQTISDVTRKNRMLLLELMESHGFINYPTEWWHFSYGDRYWAYHTNNTHALYGSADNLK